MSKLYIKNKYGQVPNEILNNPELSFKAKGLFAYLQSKPDGWAFSIERIAKQAREGKDAIRSAIQELEKFGYLQRISIKNEQGQFAGYNYILSENPMTDNSSSVGQSSERTDTLSNKDIVKKNIVKKNNSNKHPPYELWVDQELNRLVEAKREKYEKAYPYLNIEQEKEKAILWLQENKNKRKKDLNRFFLNWLNRANKNKERRERIEEKGFQMYFWE